MTSLSWAVTLRTADPRPYNLIELLSAVYVGRLATGEVVSFAGDGWEGGDSMRVRPASDYSASEFPVGRGGNCVPTLPGYAVRFITGTPFPGIRLGIWESSSAARESLVVAFEADEPCAAQAPAEVEHRILLRGSIRWRLAALEMNLDSPPSLLVVSDARVGGPLTFALYDVRPRAIRFAQRRGTH